MEAKWVNNNGQPVLIGTNNIHDAERLFRIFQEEPPELKPKLLTGRNDHAISEIFAGAGRSNSIIIATQLADRGIDIRLTEESKKNGGLHLISIGHALTTRHDRQFLGRAGRQGDPWSARFFCSLEDPLFKIFAPQWVSKMMESLGIEAEEAVEHPWVTKAIKNAQQKLREHDFWIGRQQSYLNLAFSEVQPHAKVWFEQARYFVQFDEHADDLEANLTFSSIDWLIDRYIEANFLSMLNNVRDVNYDTAKTIVALINNSFASANIKLLAEGDKVPSSVMRFTSLRVIKDIPRP